MKYYSNEQVPNGITCILLSLYRPPSHARNDKTVTNLATSWLATSNATIPINIVTFSAIVTIVMCFQIFPRVITRISLKLLDCGREQTHRVVIASVCRERQSQRRKRREARHHQRDNMTSIPMILGTHCHILALIIKLDHSYGIKLTRHDFKESPSAC